VSAVVHAIHCAAIKSLRLAAVPSAEIGPAGLDGDRRMVLVDETGTMAGQLRNPALARAAAERRPDGTLVVTIDGTEICGVPVPAEPVTAMVGSRPVPGRVVQGPWAEALSELTGKQLRLVECDEGVSAVDDSPVSILSVESCAALQDGVDPRRFRPNIVIAGAHAHEEDEWIGRRVAIGEALVRVAKRDIRCAITTRDPDTGVRDLDTLRLIIERRGKVEDEVCFGVYAGVERPGTVRVGDPVAPQ
jgi:uncharacterized protein YcbX